MTYQQPVLEKLKLLQAHFISIEADNIVDDLKPIYNQILIDINKAIAHYKREEEKEKA